MYSKVLKDDLHTCYGWGNKRIVIKRGAYVTPADNLPKGGYWVVVGRRTELSNGDGTTSYATEEVRSWAHHYGFHVSSDMVQDEV